MNKNIAIIGSGISGLASGIKALQNGYQVTIYEKNKIEGGFFQEAIDGNYLNHYLLVGKENDEIRKTLNEFIDFSFLKIVDTDYLYAYQGKEKTIYFYRDTVQLKEHLENLFPFSKGETSTFIEGIELVKQIDFSYKRLNRLNSLIDRNSRLLEKLYNKYGSITIRDFCNKINGQDLQNAITHFINEENSLVYLFLILGLYASNRLVYVQNVNEIMNHLKEEFQTLGGVIKTNSEVLRIDKSTDQSNNQLVLELKDETKEFVDTILYAADLVALCKKIIHKKYVSSKMRIYLEDVEYTKVNGGLILVYDIGKQDVKMDDTILYSFDLNRKIRVGCRDTARFIAYKNQNKLVVKFIQTNEDYEFWKIIYDNKNIYRNELLRIASDVFESLKERIGLKKEDVAEVLTPIEINEQFGSYLGGSGFCLSPSFLGNEIENEIKGLGNLIISSTWLYKPYWFYTSFISARDAVQKIIDNDSKKTIIDKIKGLKI